MQHNQSNLILCHVKGCNKEDGVVQFHRSRARPARFVEAPRAPRHGFLLDVDGSYATLDVPGSIDTFAYGINDASQIVGYYQDRGGAYRGFLRDVDGSYTTLDVPGLNQTIVLGINDASLIVGTYIDAGGRSHGFLAIPAP
jgi:hypothetical protein